MHCLSTTSCRKWSAHARRTSRGLTLIELMVALTIVGILAGIAYPNYRDYVIRGHLADASTGLSTVRVWRCSEEYANGTPIIPHCRWL